MAGALSEWIDHHSVNARLTTQASVGPYRADILIEEGTRALAVECDGAAYHNSKDQVARDKRRDRYFVVNGVSVMRYSGREINRDPRGCAAEVGLWILRR